MVSTICMTSCDKVMVILVKCRNFISKNTTFSPNLIPMARLKLPLLAVIAIAIVLSACSSGKTAYEHGNYYSAVITSVNRLRKNDDHKKSVETLQQAYPMAVAFYEDRAKASLASNAEFKWTGVVESYTAINVMYDEIRRSPGALKVIPNPVNYYSKLEEAKNNAAEENYAAGLAAMTFGTRDKAKLAYGLFKKANGYVPGYKDVIKMTETALWNATVKVVMEPIPVASRNISVSAEFFDNKVSEYLHASTVNEFVKFYTRQEAQTLKLNPDHIVKIEFDEFIVGQVFLNEREVRLEKDSVLVGTYVAQSLSGGGKTDGGNTGGGSTGGGNNSGGNTGGGDNSGGNTGGGNTGGGNNSGGGDNSGGNTGGGNAGGGNNSGGNNGGGNTGGGNNSGGNTGGGGNSGGDQSGDQDTTKVSICHVPPGNETNRHTIVIPRSALKAHLAHGDVEGTCEDEKNKKPKDPKDPKSPKDTKKPGGGDPSPEARNTTRQPVFFASANESLDWLLYTDNNAVYDTTKLYMTVKATLYHSKKTTTSKGILSFKIIDAKTNALLSVEKMPGEYVWVSEWATFNGDERALTPEQLRLTKLKEQIPPPHQDLFIEFTRPIYDQVITKIRDFYKNY